MNYRRLEGMLVGIPVALSLGGSPANLNSHQIPSPDSQYNRTVNCVPYTGKPLAPVLDDKIQQLIDQQLKCISYGGNLRSEIQIRVGETSHNFRDGFEYYKDDKNGSKPLHVFGTQVNTINFTNSNFSQLNISFMADDVSMIYIGGKDTVAIAVHYGEIDLKNFTNAGPLKMPQKYVSISDPLVRGFKESLLEIIAQKSKGGVSKDAISEFERAKIILMGSLTGIKA